MTHYDDQHYDDIHIGDFTEVDAPMPHSILGIVSLAIAAVMLVAFAVLFGLRVAAAGPDNVPLTAISGLAFIACLVVTFVGLMLGVCAFLVPDRRLVFPVLGVVCNATLFVGVIILLCFGAALGGRG
ncbi:MAG: hypothetical protein HY289_07625 [Planctomycetes bacterium]|nr:hypothetical protein [Planctomycetota bacterium]